LCFCHTPAQTHYLDFILHSMAFLCIFRFCLGIFSVFRSSLARGLVCFLEQAALLWVCAWFGIVIKWRASVVMRWDEENACKTQAKHIVWYRARVKHKVNKRRVLKHLCLFCLVCFSWNKLPLWHIVSGCLQPLPFRKRPFIWLDSYGRSTANGAAASLAFFLIYHFLLHFFNPFQVTFWGILHAHESGRCRQNGACSLYFLLKFRLKGREAPWIYGFFPAAREVWLFFEGKCQKSAKLGGFWQKFFYLAGFFLL